MIGGCKEGGRGLEDVSQKTVKREIFRGKMKLSVLEWFNLACLWNFEVDTFPFSINICDELRRYI